MEWTSVGGGEAELEPVLVVQAGEKVPTRTPELGGWGGVWRRELGGFGFAAGPQPHLCIPWPSPAPPPPLSVGALAFLLLLVWCHPGK